MNGLMWFAVGTAVADGEGGGSEISSDMLLFVIMGTLIFGIVIYWLSCHFLEKAAIKSREKIRSMLKTRTDLD